jgi:uncharacterized protein YjbJ (UPF0337 family)
MNWENIERGWKNYKLNAKHQWGKLSDEQLDNTSGRRDQLFSKVQQAYSLSKEETEKQVAEWQSRQRDYKEERPGAMR